MSKFLASLGMMVLSCHCSASPVVPSTADPAIYHVMSAHYGAAFCKAPPVTREDRDKLIKAAAAVSAPGLAYDIVFTPMDYAVIADDVPSVERLVAVGYPLAAKERFGQSLLHLAVWNGSNDVAKFLLQSGIDLNATDDAGVTPLMVAASEGRLGLTELLLSHGAKVNVRSSDGRTALDYSMICKNQALVDVLLSAGAEIDPRAQRLATKFGLSLTKHER
jgi:ankyrin repeat protein